MTNETISHPPGRLVEVNGTRLWVETEGSGEPLLLLPGGPSCPPALR
jgi:proline iminopeptidase